MRKRVVSSCTAAFCHLVATTSFAFSFGAEHIHMKGMLQRNFGPRHLVVRNKWSLTWCKMCQHIVAFCENVETYIVACCEGVAKVSANQLDLATGESLRVTATTNDGEAFPATRSDQKSMFFMSCTLVASGSKKSD